MKSINQYLKLDLEELSDNKDDFFSKTIIEDKRNKDSVKRILASNAEEFVDINNLLVKEAEELLILEK